MTVREYLNGLNELVEENPEALDYVVIYSRDDEGNAYQHVYGNGTLVEVENFDERDVDLVWDEKGKTNAGNPNAVIIN